MKILLSTLILFALALLFIDAYVNVPETVEVVVIATAVISLGGALAVYLVFKLWQLGIRALPLLLLIAGVGLNVAVSGGALDLVSGAQDRPGQFADPRVRGVGRFGFACHGKRKVGRTCWV